MTGPLVSVTTATYNCERTLARTLESVLAQTYGNIEYTVMDGMSEDGTVDVARSYARRFEDRGIRYRVFSEADAGMYDAINKAMDRSSGEVIGNINGDDVYEPRALELAAGAFSGGGFDVLYGNLRVETGTGSFIKRAAPMGAWETSRKWNHPTMFLAGRGLGYRYRTDGNPYADFDLFARAYHDGLKVVVLDEVLATFSFGGMSTRKSLRDVLKRIGWRNQVYRDTGCSPMAAVEGAVIEFVKYLRA